METLNLSLFPIQDSAVDIHSRTNEISKLKQSPQLSNPFEQIDSILSSVFPTQSEENKILRTRKYLGETANELSDEQIDCINSEFQFLIDSWLDEYEKEVFNGMTLKEVLNNG